MDTFLEKVQPLTQGQRIEAREKARTATINSVGNAPKRKDFNTNDYGKFPREVRYSIMFLITLILAAAFILSAMRLYHVGNTEFLKTIADHNSAIAAGVFIILLAEASTIMFTIAINVIGDTWLSKGIMFGLAVLATMIALSGNYYVALYHQEANFFSWLEALSPPIITIGTSFVLERFVFGMIEQRHKDQIEYEKALKVYIEKTGTPETHDFFPQAYANALFDMLISVNKDGRRKHDGKYFRDVLAQLSSTNKVALVQREIEADSWYRVAKEERQEEKPKAHEVASHSVGFLPALSQAKHSNLE